MSDKNTALKTIKKPKVAKSVKNPKTNGTRKACTRIVIRRLRKLRTLTKDALSYMNFLRKAEKLRINRPHKTLKRSTTTKSRNDTPKRSVKKKTTKVTTARSDLPFLNASDRLIAGAMAASYPTEAKSCTRPVQKIEKKVNKKKKTVLKTKRVANGLRL